MATQFLGAEPVFLKNIEPAHLGAHYAVGIVTAEWNSEVTYAMRDAAVATLVAAGLPEGNIVLSSVPGSFELPFGVAEMRNLLADLPYVFVGVIAIGCIIQGETRHFDFIAQSVANGLQTLSYTPHQDGAGNEQLIPVIFSVLTTENMEQALDRAGGKLGNKGVEGANSLLHLWDNSAGLSETLLNRFPE